MTARYDLNTLTETLFEQITNGVAYTELGDAHFTSKKIVDTDLLYVANTGVFHDDLKEWNRKPPLGRDWKNFRLHFAKAHRKWKANLLLTTGQHFPRANAVDTFNPTTNHQSDIVDA